jgi:hypothetical protein
MPWVPPALPVRDPLATQDFDDLRKYLKTREDVDTFTSGVIAAIPTTATGTNSMGFIASQFSNVVTVTHGLATTPTVALAIADSTSGAFAVCTYRNITSTTFQVVGWSPGVAITATIPFAWFVRA